MTDPASAARTARENLARGLSVLQSPGVPPAIIDVAEPIAQAMGALHKIEATQGGALVEQAPLALDAVRRGLSLLQGSAGQHPAVDQAMEAVASSLGLIHSLSQMQPAAPVAAPAPQPYVPPATAPAVPAAMGGTMVMPPGQGAAPQAQQPAYPQVAPQQAYPQAAPQQAFPQAVPQQAYPQAAPQQAYPQGGGYGAPPPAAAGAPWGQPPQAQPQPAAWPQQPAAAPVPASSPVAAGAQVSSVQAPPNVPRLDADLGAHSPSNFYKGLSGNDVIDSGGIFVATYKIPKIGTNVVIKVALPGGYEFEALGVVEWVREAPNSTAGVEAPPGFGAKFTQITPEGRQLVYRYVRNREPLFHDDL